MPIGKNALKRVTNNGYSNVSTSAPDMENSEVAEVKVKEEKPATKKSTKKPATTEVKATKAEEKKPVAKKPATKSAPKKPAAPKAKPEEKPVLVLEEEKEETTHPDGFVKIALGMDMPEYLL